MKIKRKIALVCVIAICMTMCVTTVFARDSDSVDDYSVFSYYEMAAGLVPGVSINNIARDARSVNSNIVCVMRIYSDPGSGTSGSSADGDFGHTFLTFLNASTSNITVGRHTVEPNKMVSVGKFGKFTDYKGAFYNAETNRKEVLGWYGSDKSIYMELTEDQLETVSNYLKNHQKGYLEVGNNCASYAVGAWNSVLSTTDEQYIDHFATPALVYQDIEDIGYYYVGNGLLRADYKLCYYDGSTRKECDDYAY